MAAITTDMQSGDLFAVNRSNTTYKMKAQEIIDPIQAAQDRADAAYALAEEASGGQVGDTIPVGTISWWYKSFNNNPPSGWLICNGGTFSTTAYAALFNQLSYDFGGSGNEFMVPNLKGRFIMGWASNRAKSTFQEGTVLSHSHSCSGATTGKESQAHTHGVSITTSSNGEHSHLFTVKTARDENDEYERGDDPLPNLNHTQSTQRAGAHSHSVSGNTMQNLITGTQGHVHTLANFDTDNTGSNNNYPDNVALLPIIKY